MVRVSGVRRVVTALLAVLLACVGVLGTAVSPASADDYSVSATVSVGYSPTGVAVSPDGSKVYVTNYNSASVSVIATATNTVSATVSVGDYPIGVAVSPDGSKVYVANYNSASVSVIATATNTVSATVSVGDGPVGVAVSPDGSKVYVTNTSIDSVSVIATATNTVSATVSVGDYPYGAAVSPDGSHVYVTNLNGSSVSVIATATNTVSATVSVGAYPLGVAVSPDGSRAYVTNASGASVSVIATATNTVSATVSVGFYPYGVAVSPDGSKVYVNNFYSDSVSVIATATNTVSATVSAVAYPYGVAVSPDGSKVYVTNYLSDSVSVISAPVTATAPAAPTGLSATAGDGSASIAFTAGADGGAEITKYQYKVGSGAWTDAVGTTSPITITGLTNYATAKIRLRAVNSAGAGAPSSSVSVTPRQAGPAVTSATPSGSTGIVVTFSLNPLPGTTVAYQSVVAYARGTNTVRGTCRTYGKQGTCYIGGLTRATNYDLRVTAYLPVVGKSWHNTTAAGSILQVRTNN